MEYEIIIERKEIGHQVDLRTHYQMENEKRQDPDANLGETSADNKEIMEMFLQKCLNALIMGLTERLKDVSFRIDEEYVSLKFKSKNENCSTLLPILKQSLTDYIVNELLIHWLLIRRRAWSDIYIAMRNELYRDVKTILAQFSEKKVRRRSTDLAGI